MQDWIHASRDDYNNVVFYLKIFFSPFPEVAEAVQSELETYRASEDEVKKLKAAMVSPSCLQIASTVSPTV